MNFGTHGAGKILGKEDCVKGILAKLANGFVVFVLLRLRVLIRGSVINRIFIRDSKRADEIQWRVLEKIIRANQDTEYGQRHKFSTIQSLEDFRKLVPVNTYEDLRPWFEKQEREGTKAITAETPVLYTLTSGTTGKPKFLPVLEESLAANKKIQNFFFLYMLRSRPDLVNGKILTIVSSAVEGYTENSKIPYGATTGHMYAQAPRAAKWKYVVPYEIFSIPDYDLRFRAILRLALQNNDITYMTTANPTTFIRLIDLLNDQWDIFLRDLELGTFTGIEDLEDDVAAALLRRIGPNPKRALALRKVRELRPQGRVRFRDVWTKVAAVGVWTGGSCSIFFDRLKEQFSADTLFRDVGYHSSEFRGSTPIFSDTNAGVPTFRQNFFEFVRRSDWDAGRGEFLSLTQLDAGEEYYVFVTTPSGLYRYDMNDIIRVEGYFNQLPLFTFQQKGKGATNITGEKLYENQVIAAVKSVEQAEELSSAFYVAIADSESQTYTLYYEPTERARVAVQLKVEEIAALIDNAIGEINIEYAAKRDSGRLKPLVIKVLEPGSFEALKRFSIARGQRESQFKIIALNNKSDWVFDFSPYESSIPAKPHRPDLKLVSKEGAQVS